jgi:hypothetical protein
VTCNLPGCDKPATYYGFQYCSRRHEDAGMRAAMARIEHYHEHGELPEKKDLTEVISRSSRWTPEKMRERIVELQQKYIPPEERL